MDNLARSLTNELLDLSSAIDLIGSAAAARLGINQTDLICLNLLVRNGPMSPGQLAAALGLTTAAISAMATRLEAGGYARREIDPKDRRRVLMHASPAGARQAFGLFDDFYEATTELYASSSEQELRALVDLVARFRQVITDHAARIRSGA
ncbi:MarR family winged helix-turn-helix transcriptional regulator [Nonomuraea sp. NPDC050536]|uniref:MarR family winged helix-turn-helix transcriptional regulator n=1 Tax=Nonomuraea sp. NPDC050536 TaxID=3364366 RepID=UPI0037CC429A